MYSLNTRITKAENEFDNNSKQLNEQKQIRRHNILKGIDEGTTFVLMCIFDLYNNYWSIELLFYGLVNRSKISYDTSPTEIVSIVDNIKFTSLH